MRKFVLCFLFIGILIQSKIYSQCNDCAYKPDLIASGFDEAVVKRVLRMVNMNEWKRHQTPPLLRVSPKAFGQGRRMPIVGRYFG